MYKYIVGISDFACRCEVMVIFFSSDAKNDWLPRVALYLRIIMLCGWLWVE